MSDLYEPTWQAGLADEAAYPLTARRGTPDDADPEDEGGLDEIGDDLDDEFDDVDDLEDDEDEDALMPGSIVLLDPPGFLPAPNTPLLPVPKARARKGAKAESPGVNREP